MARRATAMTLLGLGLAIGLRAAAQPVEIPPPPEADCGDCECYRDGLVVTCEDDGDADDPVRQRHILTYDVQGRLLSHELDLNADGTTEQRWLYTYDARGDVLTEVYDIEADGRDGIVRTYTYDDQGHRLTTSVQRSTYLFDEDDNRIGITHDDDGDGVADGRCMFVHPCPPPYHDCDSTCRPEGDEPVPDEN
jgi:hypothetical protein